MSNTLTAAGMTALSIINPLRPKSPDWKQCIVIGQECKCKAFEPTIVEDKGDYIWRAA